MDDQKLVEYYEAIARHNRKMLDQHPECPRYCYTCQRWVANGAEEQQGHQGHSVN